MAREPREDPTRQARQRLWNLYYDLVIQRRREPEARDIPELVTIMQELERVGCFDLARPPPEGPIQKIAADLGLTPGMLAILMVLLILAFGEKAVDILSKFIPLF